MSKTAEQSPFKTELRHLMHELGGAFLFGMPFLYTMEIWWRGNTAGPPRMLAALALTFIALVVLERAATTRSGKSVPWLRVLIEATEALATAVTVTNTGGMAVGTVRVEGKLNNQGQEEITVTTIDFLPVRAQEEVVLVFRNEPSAAVVQVVSYHQP